jgi:hypothetical protein
MPSRLFLCGFHLVMPGRRAHKVFANVAEALPSLCMLWTVTLVLKVCVQAVFLQALIEELSITGSRR